MPTDKIYSSKNISFSNTNNYQTTGGGSNLLANVLKQLTHKNVDNLTCFLDVVIFGCI